MKTITLHIPEEKLDVFMEIMDDLGFTNPSEIHISEEQKNIVRERIQKSTQSPERLKDWDEVKDNFRL